MGCDSLLAGYISIKSPDCLWWWRKCWINRPCSDSYQISKAYTVFVFKWHLSQETNPSICLLEFLLHIRCVTLVEILHFFPHLQPSELALPQTRNSISSSPLYNAQSIIWRGLLNYTTFQTDELGMPLKKQSAPTTALFVSTPRPITHFMHSRNEYVACSSSEMCRNMTLQEKNSNSSFILSVIILLSVWK